MANDEMRLFTRVHEPAELEALFERSQQEPVLLFKHDPYCGISASAYYEVERVGKDTALIDVAHDRSLSKEVADQTGVRHESPQVLVLRGGQVAWSASLYDITTDAVEDALEAAA